MESNSTVQYVNKTKFPPKCFTRIIYRNRRLVYLAVTYNINFCKDNFYFLKYKCAFT